MEKNKTFEENLANLESIVKDLETGEVNLDDAINKFNEAMKLVKKCDDELKNAEESINKILSENNKLENFKIEE